MLNCTTNESDPISSSSANGSISKTMSKKALIVRLVCFVTAYELFYAVPLFVLKVVPSGGKETSAAMVR